MEGVKARDNVCSWWSLTAYSWEKEALHTQKIKYLLAFLPSRNTAILFNSLDQKKQLPRKFRPSYSPQPRFPCASQQHGGDCSGAASWLSWGWGLGKWSQAKPTWGKLSSVHSKWVTWHCRYLSEEVFFAWLFELSTLYFMVSVEKIFPPVTFLILPRALTCSKCKENLYVCLSFYIVEYRYRFFKTGISLFFNCLVHPGWSLILKHYHCNKTWR